jgi:hypothetical protein
MKFPSGASFDVICLALFGAFLVITMRSRGVADFANDVKVLGLHHASPNLGFAAQSCHAVTWWEMIWPNKNKVVSVCMCCVLVGGHHLDRW